MRRGLQCRSYGRESDRYVLHFCVGRLLCLGSIPMLLIDFHWACPVPGRLQIRYGTMIVGCAGMLKAKTIQQCTTGDRGLC